MPWSKPNSKISIIKGVRWTKDGEHQPFWENSNARAQWMDSHSLSVPNIDSVKYTHLGDDCASIRIAVSFRASRGWTYMRIHDSSTLDPLTTPASELDDQNDKLYFYFIKKRKYINNSVTEFELELDRYVTYMFDYEIKSAFVDRMHELTDGIGDNIEPENLETGDYFIRETRNRTSVGATEVFPTHSGVTAGETFQRVNLMLCFATTERPEALESGRSHPPSYNMVNGIPATIGIYALDPLATYESESHAILRTWVKRIQKYSDTGHYDSIVSCWLYPRDLLSMQPVNFTDGDDGCYLVTGVKTTITMTSPVRPSSFKDVTVDEVYIPRNKKLLTSPYTFVRLMAYNGKSADFKYEYSQTTGADANRVQWIFAGDFTPESNIKALPYKYMNYRSGVGNVNDWSKPVEGASFPTLPFLGDAYKMYMANTQNTREMRKISAIGSGAISVLSALAGNPVGVVAGLMSTASTIGTQLASEEDKKAQSAEEVGSYSSVVNFMLQPDSFGFRADTMQICTRYAKKIDDYFSRYGYKCNGEREIYRKARANWTYVKTIGVQVIPKDFKSGTWDSNNQMCADDYKYIADMFDRGVTFWNDPDHIGDYDFYNWNNPVITNHIK